MSIVGDIKELWGDLRNWWLGWQGRLQNALGELGKKLDPQKYQAVLALLKQAHTQAEQVVNGGSMPAERVPWELSHGLDLLGQLGDRNALPKKPEELPTRVLPDGSLLGCQRWELLDYRWTEALVAWLENLDDRARFGSTPALLTIPNDVVLAIAGDWGTGFFESNAPAKRVAEVMKNCVPDYTIHLGDVYYAGAKGEEKYLRDWPVGKSGAFTLNSNHEMYSGARPYFAELQRNFPLQQNSSYFALQNDHWLIVGLDSAYESDPLNLYMDGKLNRLQLDWLRALPKNKTVIVLSHHQPCDIDGEKHTELYEQVAAALGDAPAYWYWGHLHNAICYAPRDDGFRGRCIGHGSIPYGDAKQLRDNAQVAWYEMTKAGDKNYPERVLNGFMKVALNGETIVEQFIGEDGSVRWSSSTATTASPTPAAVAGAL